MQSSESDSQLFDNHGSVAVSNVRNRPSRRYADVRHRRIGAIKRFGAPGDEVGATVTRPDGLPLYLTTEDAASLLRTTRKAVYVLIERCQLPGVRRIGRRVLIRTQDLLSWLDQQGASSLPETKR
jgi:excisionase family DNA binding protein